MELVLEEDLNSSESPMLLEMSDSGGEKHAANIPAKDLAAAATGFWRPETVEVLSSEEAYPGEGGTLPGVLLWSEPDRRRGGYAEVIYALEREKKWRVGKRERVN